jgi:hypothetical protein
MAKTIAERVATQVRTICDGQYNSAEAYTFLEMMRLLKGIQNDDYRASNDAKERAAELLSKAGYP